MAECAVIEYFFDGECVCVCVVVIAFVWIFGFQMNGGWMGVCTLQTCAWGSRRVRRKRILLLLSLCVCVVFSMS